jgi:hypothetical protein
MKILPNSSKVICGGHTDRQIIGDLISLLSFLECRLKILDRRKNTGRRKWVVGRERKRMWKYLHYEQYLHVCSSVQPILPQFLTVQSIKCTNLKQCSEYTQEYEAMVQQPLWSSSAKHCE